MQTATSTPLRPAATARPARPLAGRTRPTVHQRRSAQPPAGDLVLTPRGRLLLRLLALASATVVLAAVLAVAWVTLAASVAPGASAGDGSAGVTTAAGAAATGRTVAVVVAPGDTLWQLAREHAPARDPRSVVADVVALNDLGSTGVQAGVELLVPVG